MKGLVCNVPVASATTGGNDYYPLLSLESPALPRLTTPSELSNKYLLSQSHRRLAQRFNILQLLMVLSQLTRHQDLHLHNIAVVLGLPPLALASTLTTKLYLL